MDHRQVVETITRTISAAPGVQALFLSGSYGAGTADAFSDVDFLLVTPDGASDALAGVWREAVAQTGEIVLWWDRSVRPILINAITADWVRIDLVILRSDQLIGQSQDRLKPLYDPGGLYDTLQQTAPVSEPSRARLTYQFEEFIRILGLLPLAAGREEYINGVLGIFHLRNLLVELLIEETNAPYRGGALHLNRLLTDEQKQLLTALPPPAPNRQAMIDGHLACAAAYLPRARAFAKRHGVDWPERFEDVTWARLQDTLGLTRPYTPT